MKTLAKSTALLSSAALMISLAAPLAGQDTATETEAPAAAVSPDMVLATVNGEEITLGHVIAARLSLPEQYQVLPNEVLFPGLVDQLIQQTVLGQAMGEMTRRAQIQLDNERRSIVATEKLDEVLSDAVDEARIQAVYEEQYANAEPTQEFHASHILVATEEEAQTIRDDIEGGADFAETAREKSTGPTGPGGGDLGWFSAAGVVEGFRNAITAMEVGELGGPVQTEFGWHVIQLHEVRLKGAPSIDEVRGDIITQLEDDAVEQALETLLGSATIERADLEGIDPNVLGDLSLLD